MRNLSRFIPVKGKRAATMMIHRLALSKRRLLMLFVFGLLAVNGNQARAADLANGLYETEGASLHARS